MCILPRATRVLLTLASTFAAVYRFYKLSIHLIMYMNEGNRTAFCSAPLHWSWSFTNSCFRVGFLWPALLLLLSGVTASVLALCMGLPAVPISESPFSSENNTPLFRFGVGNKKTPVRRPPGNIKMQDNRLRLGTVVTLLLVVQSVMTHYWWQNSDTQNSMYSFASSLNSALSVALALYSVCSFVQSECTFYTGLFPWPLWMALLVQLVCNLFEIYFSFFTAQTSSIPIFGHGASSRSNYLVITTVLNLAVVAILTLVQKQTIFLRPIATLSNSKTIDDYYDASIDDSTPFANIHDTNECCLTDTPETASSLFSRMTFSWATDVFRIGAKDGLQQKDLYSISSVDPQLSNWRCYLRRRKTGHSMFMALLLTFISEAALKFVYTVSTTVLNYASPFFLQRVLHYVENTNSTDQTSSMREAYLDLFGLLFFANVNAILSGQDDWIPVAVSIQIKSFIRGELSVKTLRRSGKGSWSNSKYSKDASKAPQTGSEEGNLSNLIDSDMSKVSDILFFLKTVFSLPVSLGLGLFYIYKLLGVSALIGLAVATLYIPLSKRIFERVFKAQKAQRSVSDKRLTMVTEVIQGIRAVKLFGWESRFMKDIAEQHSRQLKYAWTILAWKVVVSVVAELMPAIVFVFILYLYTIAFGNILTAEVAFTSLSVFNTVYNAVLQVENYFTSLTQIFVSIDRMNAYFDNPNIQDLEKRVLLNVDNVLGFRDADLEWITPEENDQGQNTANRNDGTTDTDNGTVSEQTPLLSKEASLSSQSVLTANGSAALMDKLNEMPPFSLKNIDIQFPIGGFSIIAGPTGSGKSSLLSALIGEMTLVRGNIMVPTIDSRVSSSAADGNMYKDVIDISNEGLVLYDIAYVGQDTWLRNATFRENILFGEEYEKERYEEVLRVCALKPDLRIFPAGDRTEIGERGVTLSGGQKQRVALARAVYSHRRILLIDDCLSAVDAHTGKHILMECLLSKTKLMQGRTRVLITHHVPMCLPYADFMVMMNKGRVVLKGIPQDLKSQGILMNALKELDNKASSSDKAKQPADENESQIDWDFTKTVKTNMKQDLRDIKSEDEYTKERFQEISRQKDMGPDTDVSVLEGILVKEEEREKGRVKFEVWKTFIDVCGGNVYWVAIFAIMITGELISAMKNYSIRLWVVSNEGNSPATVPISLYDISVGSSSEGLFYLSGTNINAVSSKDSPAYWLSMYMFLSVVGALWGIFIMYVVCYGGIQAAQNTHKKLLRSVMHATPRFFDSTPIGRIINRFSGDMNSIDQGSIGSLVNWFKGFVSLGVTLVIILSTIPMFAFPAVVIVSAYAIVSYYYLSTFREVRRLSITSFSSVISLFSEMLHGVATIRAFGASKYYIKESLNRTGNNNRCNYAILFAVAWMGIRVNAIGSVVTFACMVFILLNVGWIDPGLAGFILTYATSFSTETRGIITGFITNEKNMTSVERVMQYLKLDQEAASESTSENKPSALWPKTGNVQFENLVAEYVPGVPVLHGISFSVHHGEKVGVVGRTGAGKSTMSLALMRFVEATKGRIVLDGIDISKIGLEDLRRNITIIPQDPVLFNGTIRYNIDPFEEYPDELIWDALSRVHMIREQTSHATSASTSILGIANSENAGGTAGELPLERMAGVFSSLDDKIEQNGHSLSAGQRQLVAMARALVRRSKLIIMDEATASVDFDTDERLQRTIRGYEFANSTLLCIAHRLRTVIDYDRVLVLDKGKVAEFDTPKNLLEKKNGIFRGMCEKSGELEYLAVIANQ